MTFDFPYGFNFSHISELMLLVPLAFFVLLGLWRKVNRRHLFIHSFVIFLLILALAAPYSVEMNSPKTNQSRITIISDESASMDLLQKGVSKEVADELNTKVPVTVTTVSGIHTSLGDAIIQQASPENYVLVVSDGQSNSGTPVEEALSYCYKNNFPVSALIPRTVEEDLSVEIEGENEAIIDNEAFFKVNIRKSTEEKMSYQVRVTIDHQKVMERGITQIGRIESIEFNHTFETLGPHTVKATLHPASISVKNLDYFENNNQYMKSVYVTPKPEVLLVTNEPDSPLANTMKEIYDVRVAGSFSSLNSTDAVIIDNQAASTISDNEARALKDYIINGGGMVVVGGDSSFDYPAEGTYQDTRFEELLPVTSKPSSWRGGRNVVLMLDVSPSTLESNGVGGKVLDDIVSNAIVLLESDLLKDARVDMITFGSTGQDITDGFIDMSKESNKLWLDAEIRKITPSTGDSTSLERGLMTARTLLNGQNKSTEAEIIIVSDGGIGNRAERDLRFERAVQCAENLHEGSGINIHFVHIHTPNVDGLKVTPKGQYYAELLMNKIGLSENYYRIEPGERIKVRFSENPEDSEDREDEYSSGSIVVYNPKHFITRNISDIQHDIYGYNEVTPKPEANRLVITRLGKPIITVWRMGLGRVAAITTDNGKGNGIPWSASLYSGNDSLIVTRTLNWAVADTESEGIQLEVPDLKMNQPGRILITTGDTSAPELYFDKKPMEITSIGNNMYESYVTSDTFGLHKISETPLEANLTEELMSETSGVKNVSWRPAAVNRPDEYTYIGENLLFRTAILENGGKIYTKGDVYSRIIEDSSTSTKKKILTRVFYTRYFLALAFLIYLFYTLHHTYNTRMK